MKKIKNPKIKHISKKALHKKAWALISEYVRRSAANEHGIVLCYTCGRPHIWTDIDCGHYIHKDCLDFDLVNLKAQCSFCNRRKHGNSGVFAERLIAEYGEQAIIELRTRSEQIKKFTITELQELIETYKQKLKEMDNR